MRRAGFSLIGLLVLISPNPLWPQSTPTTAQPEPPGASPAQGPTQNQNKDPKRTSVLSDSPGDKVESPVAVKPAASSAAAPSEEQAPSAPKQPKTEILDSSATAGALATDGHDPILDPPPFPTGMTTLVGGIITSVDRIGNHLKVKVYGGDTWTIFFDERTHVFRGGAEVTQLALKTGDRVYVDTMLDNNERDVFARNIRVGIAAPPADTEGQIIDVDTAHGEVTLRDSINSVSVRFSVPPDARISEGSVRVPLANLRAGSLVRVKFSPERPNRGEAREIVIVARPGASFTFRGPVTFLDRHREVMAVHNRVDNKTYDLHIDAARMDATANLAVGAEVNVVATFEFTHYAARQIIVIRAAGTASK